MNHERYQQFHQSIFWLYYAKAMLQAKLKQYNDAIDSFTACLNAKNYAQVLMDNPDLAKDELANHMQVLKTAEKNIAGKSSSSAELSTKATLVKLADKYKQVIMFFEQILNKADVAALDFGSMFNGIIKYEVDFIFYHCIIQCVNYKRWLCVKLPTLYTNSVVIIGRQLNLCLHCRGQL